MWKYIPGLKTPPAKDIKRKNEYFKDYENNKRARKYLTDWERG